VTEEEEEMGDFEKSEEELGFFHRCGNL